MSSHFVIGLTWYSGSFLLLSMSYFDKLVLRCMRPLTIFHRFPLSNTLFGKLYQRTTFQQASDLERAPIQMHRTFIIGDQRGLQSRPLPMRYRIMAYNIITPQPHYRVCFFFSNAARAYCFLAGLVNWMQRILQVAVSHIPEISGWCRPIVRANYIQCSLNPNWGCRRRKDNVRAAQSGGQSNAHIIQAMHPRLKDWVQCASKMRFRQLFRRALALRDDLAMPSACDASCSM